MPGATNPQTITKSCVATVVIPARRVVVYDTTTRGLVKLPAGTPEKTVCGVTRESSAKSGCVAVAVAGIAIVESDGSAVINPGDALIAVGTSGKVKTQAIAAGSAAVYNIVGICNNDAQVPATDGALVSVELNPALTVAA